jgi:hypothetical protein
MIIDGNRSADAAIGLEPIGSMIAGTVNRSDPVRALRILATFIADQVILHGLIIEDLIRRMGILQLMRRQMRHDVLVVDHTVDVRNDEVQIGRKTAVAHPRTSVQVE